VPPGPEHPAPSSGATPKRTAKAVAARAGVSVTTVSRVLNGRDDAISADTRDRVLSAARQLRYRPNSLAVALRKGYTQTVGLIVPDIADAYFHQVARGLEDAAQLAGYTVVLCNTDRIAEKERATIEVLCDQHVDAIVFAGGGIADEKHLADFPWDGMHVVAVGPHRLDCPSIRVDDAGTIELAVDHLVEQGCRRILCVAGLEHWAINAVRLDGYRRAIARHGLEFERDLVLHGSFTVESGRVVVGAALADGLAFDGVVAFNDYSAIGGMQALAEHGRRVPEEIAVVGCDDIPVSSLVHPRLTSVSFPQYDFGRAAMNLVLDLVANRPVAPVTTFPYHLEVRESSARRAVPDS
jgi:LacI family transcriptional regulator